MSGWDALGHLSTQEKMFAGWNLKIDPATVVGPVTGLIVGEMPRFGEKADMPMFPVSGNSPGGRLLKISRLTPGEFLGRIRRLNLFKERIDAWDPIQARLNAIRITESLLPGTRVLLYGQDVARAFGIHDYFVKAEHGGSLAVAIPPPFGLPSHVVAGIGLAVEWAADLRKT